MHYQWLIHIEFLVIFVTILFGYFMIKQDIDMQSRRIDETNARTDLLYETFIDLIKEKK